MPRARHCAVLGSPVAHSLSPVLHRAGYAACGLDWSYEAVEVTVAGLAGFVDGLDGSWRGLSLTMPLKRAVLPLLDSLSDTARRAGAVNTLLFEQGRRLGHNTDVPGAVAALRERHDGPIRSAVVLGGGATAASVLLALAELGVDRVELVARDLSRSQDTVALGRRLLGDDFRALPWAEHGAAPTDVLASTLPVDAQNPGVLAAAELARVVFDVVYHPWPTPLAEAARTAGVTLVSGLDLLVHQAALQFELMTGRAAPFERMRAAGAAAIAR